MGFSANKGNIPRKESAKYTSCNYVLNFLSLHFEGLDLISVHA